MDYGITINLVQLISPPTTRLLLAFYGISEMEEIYSPAVVDYRARVDMLALMSRDDPAIWISNRMIPEVLPVEQSLLFHHPYHARELKERADSVGLKNVTYIPELEIMDPSDEDIIPFLLRHLEM